MMRQSEGYVLRDGAAAVLVGLRRTGARRRVPIDGVETDADFFCVTSGENGNPLRAMMQAGTSLKVGGTTLASSPGPATVAMEM